ncbi:hypothetical protein ABZX65_08710 [Streptomyces sp. NPDC003300]|uniref:hypothetical protein n=1 Tax=unclassified Streptomyces TaxID=2593676 RepID=UPI0033A14543
MVDLVQGQAQGAQGHALVGERGGPDLGETQAQAADTVFLAVHGVQTGGLTAASEPEADIGRALIAAARRTVVLPD